MTPAGQLRPFEIGEIIDRAVTFWRRRVWTLFQLSVGFQLLSYALGKAFQLVLERSAPLLRDPGKLDEVVRRGMQGEEVRQLAIAGSASVAWMVLAIAVTWIANVLIASFTIAEVTGRPHSIGDAVKRLMRRMGSLAGTFVIAHAWALGAFALAMVPGLLLFIGFAAALERLAPFAIALFVLGGAAVAFGMLFITLWYVLRFMLAPPVIAAEDGGAWATFKRSNALISGRVGPRFVDRQFIRATLVLTVMFVVVIVVGVVTSIPALLVQSAFGNIFDPTNADPSKIPQALLIPAELFEVFCASLVSPLTFVLGAFFYLDARMRREGLDLELKLDALAQRRAA